MSQTENICPMDALAEDFLKRLRLGESPTIEEYARANPEHAEEIRDVFPTLAVLEKARPKPNTRVATNMPKVVGDYRIIRELGRGGMGVVYEAEHMTLRRHVALKTLPTERMLDPKSLLRFRREARAAARMHHTNIVPVFEIGFNEGVHFYAMQYIDGESLSVIMHEVHTLRQSSRRYVRDSCDGNVRIDCSSAVGMAHNLLTACEHVDPPHFPTAPIQWSAGCQEWITSRLRTLRVNAPGTSPSPHPDDALLDGSPMRLGPFFVNVANLALQIADALHFAHNQGIVHRDIKPANLLLDVHGTIWITDFGLAKDGSDEELTQSGDVLGTLRYVAPERFRGRSDGRSDIYSLGVTLYELISGAKLFGAVRSHSGPSIQNREAVPLSRIEPCVPRDLHTIIMKCVAIAPEHRYPDAGALADDLRRFLANRPIRARPVGVFEKAWLWCIRNPVPATLSTITLLCLVAASVAGWFSNQLRTERDSARRAEATALTAQIDALNAKRLADAQSFLVSAIAARQSDEPNRRSNALTAIQSSIELAQLLPQDETQALLRSLRDEAVSAWSLDEVSFGPQLPGAVAIDGLAKRTAMIDGKSILLAGPSSLQEQHVLACDDLSVEWVGFSPQSTFLWAAEDFEGGGLQLWNLATRTPVFSSPRRGGCRLTFAADDRWFAIGNNDQSVNIYDTNDISQPVLLHVNGNPRCMAIHPTEAIVAVSYWKSSLVEIWSRDSLELIASIPAGLREITSLAWHPHGELLALAGGNEACIEIWSWADALLALRLGPIGQHYSELAFNQSGSHLICSDWDGNTRVWESTGASLDCVIRSGMSPPPPTPVSNVLGLTTATTKPEVVRLEQSPIRTAVHGRTSSQSDVILGGAFAADGEMIISFSSAGLEFWSCNSGAFLGKLPIHGCLGVIVTDAVSEIYVATRNGIIAIPFEVRDQATQRFVTLGDPRLAWKQEGIVDFSASQNGQMACVVGDTLAALDTQTGVGFEIALPEMHDEVQISGNGKLIVTYGWHSQHLEVIDTARGEVIRRLDFSERLFAKFSADSQFLIVTLPSRIEYRDIETWEVVKTIARINSPFPDDFMETPHGDWSAAELSPGILSLIDSTAAEPFLRLKRQNRRQMTTQISDDGTRLLTITKPASLEIWDLERIERELVRLGLAWKPLRFARNSLTNSITLHGLGPVNSFLEQQSSLRTATAQERYRAAYVANPNSAASLNNYAWSIAMSSDADDYPMALNLAEGAVERDPQNPLYANTLGLTLLRAAEYRRAVDILRGNLKRQSTMYRPFDLCLLAIAHAQLGDYAEAQAYWIWCRRELSMGAAADLPSDDLADFDVLYGEAQAMLADRDGKSPN